MIIVTGANGFIGSAIVWELNQRGIVDIVCVDSVGLNERKDPLANRNYQKFLSKDEIWMFLASPEAKNVSWIIHMGACSSTTETNWEFLNENNYLYSQKLFDWCTSNSKNFIYASSAATYGDGSKGFDDEGHTSQFLPLNLYGKSKLIMDQYAERQVELAPPNWYGLKFFNVFGPNEYLKENMSSVAYKACHQIKKSKQLGLFKSYHPAFADGEQKRDFIYVKDITRWICELFEKKPPSGIYNMGSGEARTWLDLARSVFGSLNIDININWLEMPENIRQQYQYFTEARMQKWLRVGMSSPHWTLETAIKDYVENYLKLGDVWL